MLGSGKKKIPLVVYFFTIVQVAVFIGELVKNGTMTGSPIMIKPQFNPMIGPSPYVLINMGARFVPCMHNVKSIQDAQEPISWPCPWSTTNDPNTPDNSCTLSDLCGFGGVPEPLYQPGASLDQKPEPNQWFRFIVPIFLHAGLIHIGFNMLLQLTLGRDMEKSIGSIRFFIVYMSAGIFGFVMGGNFAATGIASTGASGSLFGIIALTFLDLLYSWKDRVNPTKDLMYLFIDILISLVLGLLPGLDNFSHIGGFLMGLALGICILHSPNSLRRRIGESDVPYANSQVSSGFLREGTVPPFFKNPVGFFKGRKPLWWGWWLIRVGALILVLVVFVLLLNNFYIHHKVCGWCKYLSCLPVNNWCELGNLTITRDQDAAQQQQAAKRAVEALMGMSRRVVKG
ncbi:rhomboid family-domain-containing protein [Cercophora samala]|uniref:Rhomboid-type serine protease n=1 Tax=Cercophora samala TaxID=330535 RepID=A0AA39ZH32_9PEZI|nr:rhomboid family-domain-containing protein [Cercophora samala]